ncbi:hypothetical protein [Streptomyces sp. NBC_00989]|uniref:hypothetical protein n=1 Tax=Streptomyces sp. NBC_00989 TaxID=2903705 RepID=UPI002F914FD8|nr:hypothetical protein OG714_54860 [Streptomyces sp. NBC_00989]
MTNTSAMPTARKRAKRARTRRVNDQPSLKVSTLHANDIDLLPGTESLICPDCDTWVPITGVWGRHPKLVPHHSERAGTPDAVRCENGSLRSVELDLKLSEWQHRLGEAITANAARRRTPVRRKPKTPPTPATSQVVPTPISADMVRRAFRAHRAECKACQGTVTDRDGIVLACPDGLRLAGTYLRLLRQEPERRALRVFFEQERERFDRTYEKHSAEVRSAGWATQQKATTGSKHLAKRSGTAVEDLNNQARRRQPGMLSDYRGPCLPLEKPTA